MAFWFILTLYYKIYSKITLLQNTTFCTKLLKNGYYKIQQNAIQYNKMRRLLQDASVQTYTVPFIKKH